MLPVSLRKTKTERLVSRTYWLQFVHQKLFEKLISQEINTNYEQFGFHEGLGFQNAHTTFLAVLDCYRMLKKNLYMCSIDISKVFDSIIHSHAIFSLLRSGIKSFLCCLFWNQYCDASIRGRLGNQLSKSIPAQKGVKQGSMLGPILFNNSIQTVASKYSSISNWASCWL